MRKKKLLVILGNLTAFGPFVTDFYLPCLPKMTRHFIVSPSLIQLSLTTGMIGLAIGQIIIGPISDKYGRKRPLLWSLALFALTTIGCMLSANIWVFIAFRLFQGLAGSSALVISKAIVSDMFEGQERKRFYAFLATIQGIAPILAPIIGGLVFTLSASWKGPFVVLTLWVFWLLYDCSFLKESLKKETRLTIPIYKSFKCYTELFKNSHYITTNLLFGFSSAALMTYISSSPFIFQEHFGLSAMQYSIFFACNAIGLVLGSAIIVKIRRLPIALEVSVLGILFSCLLTSITLIFNLPFVLFEFVLFILLFSVGMITPVSMTMALDAVEKYRGMASALIGASPYILGGIVAPLTGLGNMIHSVTYILLICAIICLGLYFLARYTQK